MATNKKMILAIGIVAFFITSCSSKENKMNEEVVAHVETYQPGEVSGEGVFLSGVVSAEQSAVISTRMMGFVKKVYVKQGDKVHQGQLLIAINSDDLNAKKAQAQAMLMEAEAAAKNAGRDYERFQKLHALKSVSDKELENVALNNTSMQAKVQMARQGLNEVKAMLAYTNITAPFSGVITQKMTEEGSTASPGMPLFSLEQTDRLEVTASVSENYIQYMKVGDSVRVELKSLNRTTSGIINELSPSSSMTGGQYSMKIAIRPEKKEDIRTGMYVGVHLDKKIKGQSENKVMVDLGSVVYRDQLTGVYVATDDRKALLRWVRLGKKIGDRVEVLSGLQSKDVVVRNADRKLYNGIKLVISNK